MNASTRYVILGLVLALVLYVLSAGPIVGYYLRGNMMPPSTVIAFYMPLGWCCSVCPPLGELMRQYVKLWAPNA